MALSPVAVTVITIISYVVFLLMEIEIYQLCQSLLGNDVNKLLNPMSLNITQLKNLLHVRGYPKPKSFEKQDYVSAVIESGPVKLGDIINNMKLFKRKSETIESRAFTSDEEFFEIVEDTKDSVWLVQVVKDHQSVSDLQWDEVVQQMSQFGVRTGKVDCSVTPRFCYERDWNYSQLLAALPRGYNVKADIFMTKYTGTPQSGAIINWLSDKLSSRVRTIKDKEDLLEWFDFVGQPYLAKKYPTRIIYFTTNNHIPLVFSAMSIKYTGRVRFGVCFLNSRSSDSHRSLVANELKGQYLIATRNWNITYTLIGWTGLNSFQSMNIFLKTIAPDVNDIFILTLFFINIYCLTEALVFINQRVVDRILRFIWNFVKLNLIIILMWIPVTAVLGFWPFNMIILEYLLPFLRRCSITHIMDNVRWLLLYGFESYFFLCLLGMFIIWCTAIGCFLWKYSAVLQQRTRVEFCEWLAILRHRNDWERVTDIEDGNSDDEGLIDQLAMPNFWLRPRRSLEYINQLPRWKYVENPVCRGKEQQLLNIGRQSFGQKECNICIEEYIIGAELCGLPCGHTFHEFCVLQWLFRGNYICPTCRWPAYKNKPVKRHRE